MQAGLARFSCQHKLIFICVNRGHADLTQAKKIILTPPKSHPLINTKTPVCFYEQNYHIILQITK
jgi:hypothetical protein